MGLDMYLEGRTFNWKTDDNIERRDGFRVKGVTLELGYWRKHPDLHGYIVQKFAGGEDKCQQIPLNEDALRDILQAVKDRRLPHTEGFFFGQSQPEDRQRTIKILEAAIKWLEGETPPRRREAKSIKGTGLAIEMLKPEDFADAKESREVIYQASW